MAIDGWMRVIPADGAQEARAKTTDEWMQESFDEDPDAPADILSVFRRPPASPSAPARSWCFKAQDNPLAGTPTGTACSWREASTRSYFRLATICFHPKGLVLGMTVKKNISCLRSSFSFSAARSGPPPRAGCGPDGGRGAPAPR